MRWLEHAAIVGDRPLEVQSRRSMLLNAEAIKSAT